MRMASLFTMMSLLRYFLIIGTPGTPVKVRSLFLGLTFSILDHLARCLGDRLAEYFVLSRQTVFLKKHRSILGYLKEPIFIL